MFRKKRRMRDFRKHFRQVRKNWMNQFLYQRSAAGPKNQARDHAMRVKLTFTVGEPSISRCRATACMDDASFTPHVPCLDLYAADEIHLDFQSR
jgi:hypothetical protein